jgi:preprotein translocase SecE subunit
MAGRFGQYLRDTKTELRHVAWPTRTQTIVYALLVAVISVGIALYLGVFDFAFRAGLVHFLSFVPQRSAPAVQTSPITVTQTPAATSPATKSK